MDHVAEQLLKKQESSTKKILFILAVVVLTLVTLLVALFVAPICIALTAGVIYLGAYFYKFLNVEYEYSMVNGTLDIDKILGQVKRVPLLSIDVGKFTAYGEGDLPNQYENLTCYSALGLSMMSTNDGKDDGARFYYAVFEHPEQGVCALEFCPNEPLRLALEPYLPRTIRYERSH